MYYVFYYQINKYICQKILYQPEAYKMWSKYYCAFSHNYASKVAVITQDG